MNIQGRRANQAGKILESHVETTLTHRGFQLISYKDWERLGLLQRNERWLIKRFPFMSIYSAALPENEATEKSNTEFVISDPATDSFVRVECKWQAVSGSVDEKLPYLYLNVVERFTEKEIIILIDGDGWKKGALLWLREAVDSRRWRQPHDNRNIFMFTMGQFTQWAQSKFS